MKFIRGDQFGAIWHAGIEIEGEPEPALPKPGHYVIRTEAGIIEEYDSLQIPAGRRVGDRLG